jgi:hypothetical protein
MALGILLAVLASLASASVWAGTEGPEAGPQAPLSPLGARFTYQGRLTHNDGPVNDLCDFQFGLYDAGSSVTPIDMQTLYDVEVTGGFFTVHVDFGPTPFRGEERWLGIAVRCPAGSGTYTPFSERQLLTATPYALYAAASEWDGIAGIPPDFGDGVDNDTLYFPGDGLDLALDNSFSLLPSFRLPQSCGDGMVTKWESAISRWVCGDDNVGVGAEAWLLTGNAGTEHGLHRLGTTDSVSLTLVVDSAPALRLEFTGQAANLVGGDPVNR